MANVRPASVRRIFVPPTEVDESHDEKLEEMQGLVREGKITQEVFDAYLELHKPTSDQKKRQRITGGPWRSIEACFSRKAAQPWNMSHMNRERVSHHPLCYPRRDLKSNRGRVCRFVEIETIAKAHQTRRGSLSECAHKNFSYMPCMCNTRRERHPAQCG